MYLELFLDGFRDLELTLFDDKKSEVLKKDVSNLEILPVIDEFLKENNIAKEDIKGVVVVFGKASFTSTRVLSIIANSFAFVLDIPVLGVGDEKKDDFVFFLEEFQKGDLPKYVYPEYNAEPNIGGRN